MKKIHEGVTLSKSDYPAAYMDASTEVAYSFDDQHAYATAWPLLCDALIFLRFLGGLLYPTEPEGPVL